MLPFRKRRTEQNRTEQKPSLWLSNLQSLMEESKLHMNPNSGFCSKTNTYHTLRPSPPPPPSNTSLLSISDYIFSLHHKQQPPPPPTTISSSLFIDSTTGNSLTYSQFSTQVKSLSIFLQSQIGLSKGDTAFILSPPNLQIPILYFSLFSLGVTISPSNPSNTPSEISHQINLCKPIIAFATSSTALKLPPLQTFLLDSPDFLTSFKNTNPTEFHRVEVNQSDTAVILYSSGTTGRVKGVALTHSNLISYLAGIHSNSNRTPSAKTKTVVVLSTVPYFHIFGFNLILKAVALEETMVMMMERFDVMKLMKVVEEFKVTNLIVAPPVVVMLTKIDRKMMDGYDLRSLDTVLCGAAPLGNEVVARFKERFPNNVSLPQVYGLTETSGGVSRSIGLEESRRFGSTGKLVANCIAKIVDPDTGFALPPCKQGELWVKGPTIMKGYVGEEEATAAAFDSDGWFKTGDLCYIDDDGFLYVVDRLKELIKYKGYQVAPAELEKLLQSHPDIIDAAVIPYPNEEAGEVPMAFVVKRSRSSINESQIKDIISKQVAPYKKIRRVAFIDSIPKNAAGKILRKDLIKLALSTPPTSKL